MVLKKNNCNEQNFDGEANLSDVESCDEHAIIFGDD